MKHGARLTILVTALQLCLGCGGQTGLGESDGGNDAVGALDALWNDVRSVPECAAPALVPAGTTYLGAWTYAGGTFVPSMLCGLVSDDAGYPIGHDGNRQIFVEPFLLMAEPVTNACYARCVTAGACPEPVRDAADPDPKPWSDATRQQQPVYVDYASAESFCSWAGGYVPDLAQLLRAEQGDARKPGVAAMTDAVLTCQQRPGASQLCGQIDSMYLLNPKNELWSVGQMPADVGPFGHRDFGDGFEWTQTLFLFQDPRFCALQDEAADFGTFRTSQFPGVVQFETMELQVFRGYRDDLIPGPDTTTSVSYTITFRCAFGDRPKPG